MTKELTRIESRRCRDKPHECSIHEFAVRRRPVPTPGTFELHIGFADGKKIAAEFVGRVSSKDRMFALIRAMSSHRCARKKSIDYSFQELS